MVSYQTIMTTEIQKKEESLLAVEVGEGRVSSRELKLEWGPEGWEVV